MFAATLGREGGFSDDPKDSGGATKYGITERVARAWGYTGDMRDLPLDDAEAIAKAMYWDPLRLDQVDELAPSVAHELFDTGYNMGIAAAGRILQRALNALNREQADYPDVEVDGVVGLMTIAALRAYITRARRGKQGVAVLLRALNVLQGAEYIAIAERSPPKERFVFGWLLNRVTV